MSDKAEITYQAIELARSTGKVKKGCNEVTKSIERGTAKFVAVANDVSPKEIIMHIPALCKEKQVPCVEVGAKTELGAAAGLPVGTVCVAITKEGEAKDLIAEISKE